MTTVFGPLPGNTGIWGEPNPPSPIPEPGFLTRVHCEQCHSEWNPEIIKGLEVFDDSHQTYYQQRLEQWKSQGGKNPFDT